MPTPAVVRLYRPQGTDHVAVVSVQSSWLQEGAANVLVARGPHRHQMRQAAQYGPLRADQVDGQVALLVADLRAEGFVTPGVPAMLAALADPKPRARALAAQRLGWLGEAAAVEPLLAAAAQGRNDIGTLVDALGRIGDPRAIPLARQEAARKLLSRRRSGCEALRNLGDAEGLAAAAERARERLPEAVRVALDAAPGDLRPVTVQALVEAIGALPARDRGLALDNLYDLATPLALLAVPRSLATLAIDEPHAWRYAKSILKRAALRGDPATFGFLVHRVETLGRKVTGTKATLKSGLDGKPRETWVFGRRTRDHVRRLGWRHLRRLAVHRPDSYASFAAEAIVSYEPGDQSLPHGDHGAFAGCYLLHRVLWGGGGRYQTLASLRHRRLPGVPVEAPEGVREEAFPELWDAQPRAYLRLLGGSRLAVVQEFARRAVVERHRDVLEAATPAEVVALLGAPWPPTVELGVAELRRRFDPARPDWPMLQALVDDERPAVRELTLSWLEQTAGLWVREPVLCVGLLVAADPAVRELAVRLARAALAGATAEQRRALATQVLLTLRGGEPIEGAHQALAALAREELLPELDGLVPIGELAELLSSGSVPLVTVAAALLGRQDAAVEELGLSRIAGLAGHELAALRSAAIELLGRALPRLAEDPSLLLEVAGCDWPDSRAGAVVLLRRIPPDAIGLEAVLELLDSSRPEVQALGQELLLGKRGQWDPLLVVGRLLEHPEAGMRPFVLELVERELEGDLHGLPDPGAFFRKVLLDLRPGRAAKRRAIALLLQDGLRSRDHARSAASILNELLRSHTRADFEPALQAMAQLQLEYPGLDSPLSLEAR